MAWHRSALKIYRTLLLAYPGEFRREYGPQMLHLFSQRLGHEPQWRLWLEAVTDLSISAPREHFHLLLNDVRHSTRLFAKSPGFTALALLVIALGIGASTTIYSLIHAILIRSLPYGNPQHLVYMWTPNPGLEGIPKEMAPPFADVIDWRRLSHSFSNITALRQKWFMAGNERISGARVEANFFATLQASPQTGRTFDANDEFTAVISDALAQSLFSSNIEALGKPVVIDKKQYTIVGVMPKDFGFPHSNDYPYAAAGMKRTDIWIPLKLTSQQQAGRDYSTDVVIGRLRPGVSIQQAQPEMMSIEKQLDPLYPEGMRGWESLLVPFLETTLGPVRPLLRIMMAAVFLVLLISCSNVANLLLARASGRVHEFGVRSALGAERSRIIRQMLTESILLALIGGLLGAALSFAAIPVIRQLNPGDIPRFEEVSLDVPVLQFALLLSLANGVLFGLLPAFSASRRDALELLRQGGGRGTVGSHSRARSVLIIAQVSLAVLLLSCSTLLIRSYLILSAESKGFSNSTLTMRLELNNQSRESPQLAKQMKGILERVSALPGVTSAGAIDQLPLSHSETATFLNVQGYPNRPKQLVHSRGIAGDYFRAMQIRLITGRYLTSADIRPEANIVVVSESFVKTYLRNREPLRAQIQLGGNKTWHTIVGVVADVRHTSVEQLPLPTVYQALWQTGTLTIRSSLPQSAAAIRQAIKSIDPEIAITDSLTMADRITDDTARRRFQTVLLTALAAIALFLALAGLYALISHSVAERTQEIGVRIALGATRPKVIAMVVSQGMLPTAIGLTIGLTASIAATRSIAAMLYGVQPVDPTTFLAVPILLLIVTVVACAIPAYKAAGVDPATALRQS